MYVIFYFSSWTKLSIHRGNQSLVFITTIQLIVFYSVNLKAIRCQSALLGIGTLVESKLGGVQEQPPKPLLDT